MCETEKMGEKECARENVRDQENVRVCERPRECEGVQERTLTGVKEMRGKIVSRMGIDLLRRKFVF